MNRSLFRLLLPALPFLALLLPLAATAQQGDAAQGAREAAALERKLAELQARALEAPAVAAAQAAVEEEMKRAMVRADPAAAARIARAEGLREEVEAARTEGDNAKLNQLASEAQSLQSYFVSLRARAVEDAALAARTREFQEVLVGEMIELEPQADAWVDRLATLRGVQR